MRTSNNGINHYNQYYGKKCHAGYSGRNRCAQRTAGLINKKDNRQNYVNLQNNEEDNEQCINHNAIPDDCAVNNNKNDVSYSEIKYNNESENETDNNCENDGNGTDGDKNNEDNEDSNNNDDSNDNNNNTTARSHSYLIILAAIIAFILISKLDDSQLDFLATFLASVSGLLFLSISSTGQVSGAAGVPL